MARLLSDYDHNPNRCPDCGDVLEFDEEPDGEGGVIRTAFCEGCEDEARERKQVLLVQAIYRQSYPDQDDEAHYLGMVGYIAEWLNSNAPIPLPGSLEEIARAWLEFTAGNEIEVRA